MKKENTEITLRTKEAIQIIRGKHAILDSDLAKIYGVETKRLNEQVKRNSGKFPEDFRFQLTADEYKILRSQNATSSDWGGRRSLPYAFTEHGVLQAANVINSAFADSISIFVIRAFIDMREVIAIQESIKGKKKKDKSEATGKLSDFLSQIGPRLQQTVDKIMDTIIDPDKGSTVGQEGQDIIIEAVNHLKSRLKKTGLENEEIAARITKLLAEAENERAMARKTKAETEQLEFMTMVKKLKLVLEARKLMHSGEEDDKEIRRIDSFIGVLKEVAGETATP